MSKKLEQILSKYPNWKVVLRDEDGHEYVGYGNSCKDVWGQVADVENFNIDTTICTIYELGIIEHQTSSQVLEWQEYLVLYGDEKSLISKMSQNNFTPKDVL